MRSKIHASAISREMGKGMFPFRDIPGDRGKRIKLLTKANTCRKGTTLFP
jgi:hypothetical protein